MLEPNIIEVVVVAAGACAAIMGIIIAISVGICSNNNGNGMAK